MIEQLLKAQDPDRRFLVFLQLFFLFWTTFGFAYFAVEHWVIDHIGLSFHADIAIYIALIGFPLSLLMFFTTNNVVRWLFTGAMALTVAVGIAGALYHLFFNASDLGVSVFSFRGFFEAFTDPYRPILAALAHVNVGAVGLVVGLTFDPDIGKLPEYPVDQ
jgi:hypothetical protein